MSVEEYVTPELLSPPPKKKECKDCRKLPTSERPATWRPIDKRSKPNAPRCHTHMEAFLRAHRTRAAARKARDRYGMTPEDKEELAAEQGGTCPCGRRFRHHDHDHALARQHGHQAPQRACKACMRGLLCHNCNSYILGRGYDSTMLRALADYYDDPPARRLWSEGVWGGVPEMSG